VLTPADYNGDGRLEPSVYRLSTHVYYVLGQPNLTYGTNGDQPVLDVALERRGV
jgi:hypothetical protein